MVEVAAWLWLFVPIWLIVSVLAGIDAGKNSSQNAFIWALSVFVGGILGLLLYINLGRDQYGEETTAASDLPTQRGLTTCPNCQSLEDTEREVCRVCGEPL
ncbi:hypothetical protein GJR96_04375 [Haloferax sp. MBLA0076]|uniref:Uncharacterized protein n=1 Tax=Haloferax litoreum TaxID=2666140 RepID=A0A6A8GD23_9EURY|nr:MULTISPECIES: hypothetical protein [Haloferax]KAB1192717.1 hypothetical protein Hfx1148_04365 [Haloferax sp. CBA1148]MRX21194.1 hypothetical protein [Haloferax litoreum]